MPDGRDVQDAATRTSSSRDNLDFHPTDVHRGRRRQPARRRHRRLVQALLPDLAARQAGRAGGDLPRPPQGRPAASTTRGAQARLGDAGRRATWSRCSTTPARVVRRRGGRGAGRDAGRRRSPAARRGDPTKARSPRPGATPSGPPARIDRAEARAAVRDGPDRRRRDGPPGGDPLGEPLARPRGRPAAASSCSTGPLARRTAGPPPRRSGGSATRRPSRRAARRGRGPPDRALGAFLDLRPDRDRRPGATTAGPEPTRPRTRAGGPDRARPDGRRGPRSEAGRRPSRTTSRKNRWYRTPLYGQQCNPRASVDAGKTTRYHRAVRDPRFPYVLTTYRLTEHHTAGGMTRWLSWLSELQPEMFCEVSPELAAERGSQRRLGHGDHRARRDRGRVLVTERMRPSRIAARTVHQIGLPYHWGSRPRARRQRNDLLVVGGRPQRADPGVQGPHRQHRARPAEPRARAAGAGPALPRSPVRARPARRRARRSEPRSRRGTGDEGCHEHKGFFTDTTLCIGCKACEVACKQWNQLPDDGFVFTGHVLRQHRRTWARRPGGTWPSWSSRCRSRRRRRRRRASRG